MPTDIYLADNVPRMCRPDLIITLRANYQAGNHLEVIRLCHWEMVVHIGLYGPPGHLRPGRSIGNHHVYDWTRNEDYPEEEPPIQQAVIGAESRFWWSTPEEMADDISLLTSTAHSAAAIAAAAQLAQRPEELSILLSTAELGKK